MDLTKQQKMNYIKILAQNKDLKATNEMLVSSLADFINRIEAAEKASPELEKSFASEIQAVYKSVGAVQKDLLERLTRSINGIKPYDDAALKKSIADLNSKLNAIKLNHGKDGRHGRDGANGRNGRDGVDGKDGAPGADGKDGANGTNGTNGLNGFNGDDGKSAYQIWLDLDNTGTEQDFIDSLSGSADIDADDIDDTDTVNKFVTAEDITKLGNLSGTNTGDQDAADIDIADAGSYYTGTTAEAALQEIGAALAGILGGSS